MIKIILVEDHQLMRSSMNALMQKYGEFSIVAEASNGKELLQLLDKEITADIILSDMLMPEMDGIQLLNALKEKEIDIPVVILSVLEDEKYASNAFVAGARGYLSKNVGVDELLFCLQHVLKGNRYFASDLCIAVLERFNKQLVNFSSNPEGRIVFSDREISVLKLVAEGMTNQQIADQLFLSRRTVEGIRQVIIDRTGSKNSAAVIRFAVLNGYIA